MASSCFKELTMKIQILLILLTFQASASMATESTTNASTITNAVFKSTTPSTSSKDTTSTTTIPVSGDPKVTAIPVSGDSSVTSTPVSGDSSVTSTPVSGDSNITAMPVSGDSSVTFTSASGDSNVAALVGSFVSVGVIGSVLGIYCWKKGALKKILTNSASLHCLNWYICNKNTPYEHEDLYNPTSNQRALAIIDEPRNQSTNTRIKMSEINNKETGTSGMDCKRIRVIEDPEGIHNDGYIEKARKITETTECRLQWPFSALPTITSD